VVGRRANDRHSRMVSEHAALIGAGSLAPALAAALGAVARHQPCANRSASRAFLTRFGVDHLEILY
jgi:hypothetical protein